MLLSGIVSFIVGLISGWFLASTRPALGTKAAHRMIRIGEIKTGGSQPFAELYVNVGASSAGPLGFLLPLCIRNVRGRVTFERLPDGEVEVYQGLRWLPGGLDVNSIDITLPGEYELVIMTEGHGVLYPGDDVAKSPLTGTFSITVEILGPTKRVIAKRSFPRAITDGKIAAAIS